jgi:predicted PhzF superfamily epimerase YddE/YHI9
MGTRGGETLVYLWAPTGPDTVEARALFTQGAAAIEDPATGSACSNLGAWLAAQGRTGLAWEVSQGTQAGRPSTLRLAVEDDGTVRVGGLVHPVGEGTVEI